MKKDTSTTQKISPEFLRQIEQRLLWLSHWMIHHANHIRSSENTIKTGGHQASSASMVSILTALYFVTLKNNDRVAVKPHASPIFHAMQYLMGKLDLEHMKNFRGFGGIQPYPSRTKDIDDVDFSTGSVGLGVAITSFASIIQDYITEKDWCEKLPVSRMVALMGDAELDEGNIYECLQEGWKHDVRNVWWIIDYNRQSLDGIVHEGVWERAEKVFQAFDWQVVRIKYGKLQKAAFKEPGGKQLKEWIDTCPNEDYSALTYLGGENWRRRLLDDLSGDADVVTLIESRCDATLAKLMENLGGNCVETLSEQFSLINHDKPVCFLAYTIKGWGTPIAGHKDNHSGLMTPDQMQEWKTKMGVSDGNEWEPFESVSNIKNLKKFLDSVSFFKKEERRYEAAKITIENISINIPKIISSQAGFGKILDQIAQSNNELSKHILTASPDVSGTTSLGPWINRKKLFGRKIKSDHFSQQRIPSTAKWETAPEGQHIELGIAEMNLFLLLAAAGLSHSIFGKRLLPIGTIYDPFISRGLDALNYGCYQDARFMLVGTPSGVSLAPEGGAHQSIGTPLIGMSQDGLASFEPAFMDELVVVMNWAFDYMQRDGQNNYSPVWLRDYTGGSVYLRLTTKPLEQPIRHLSNEQESNIINGAYWLRQPGPNCQLVIAYQGAVADEAIKAAGTLGERYKDVAVLAVTSADRLNAGWTAAQSVRRNSHTRAKSHVEVLLESINNHANIVTVIDGHPATLAWLGSVYGHKLISLGVEHFGQAGTIKDLYTHFDIDADAICSAALSFDAFV
ncbi:1-deoxy-D-xylulose-5-phosphate synthase N-terminal domain-containing protein [Rhodospirillales bacterium]|nr:1-deoxy-D-xylulose-5-phosphate synthase N-terminal domain-containing protein [Rhodospirillales bacterium]